MRVLVVEDDPETGAYICKGLREGGHVVDAVASGSDAVQLLLREAYDVAVLDRGLPDLDGLSALRAIRAAGRDTPVLLLSALGNTDERVRGLKAGADDYMAKPFSFEELSARLQIISARRRTAAETTLVCGDLEMDLLARTVTRGGKRLQLLPREFQLLEELLRNKGRVVTRTSLLERVWDYRFDPHTSLIDTHMSRLRKKVDDGFDCALLHTVRGVGFRIAEEP
jgi:two-component system OmpR family response regulator